MIWLGTRSTVHMPFNIYGGQESIDKPGVGCRSRNSRNAVWCRHHQASAMVGQHPPMRCPCPCPCIPGVFTELRSLPHLTTSITCMLRRLRRTATCSPTGGTLHERPGPPHILSLEREAGSCSCNPKLVDTKMLVPFQLHELTTTVSAV
jgi:hypothetical protein